MALGAARREVMGLVLTNALRRVGAGLAIGVPVAFWSTRVAASMIENPSAGGAWPIVVPGAVTVGVAIVAAYVPARRATRVDPLIVLRSE